MRNWPPPRSGAPPPSSAPRRERSRNPYDHARRAIVTLGGFLKAFAPGGGYDPELLTEEHAHAFAADMRHRAGNGLPAPGISRRDGRPSVATDQIRHASLNYVRKIMRWALDTGAVERLVTENITVKQRVRDLTATNRTLDERLQSARSNNRFLDKRIAGLEAQLLNEDPAT